MEITSFKIEHFDRIELKNGCWARREDRELIQAYGRSGPAATLIHGDKVIMCGGVACSMWPGLGDLWLIPSIYVNKYPLTIFKVASSYISNAIDTLKLHRVQAIIMQPEVKWIEKLGFEREGLLRKFGPNKEDKYIYARVK